ncbi:hypothetical protein BF17_16535 [Yersinia similis]|uniref:Phage protein n=1 Tax=Yersinia similis TaxID=367190 RepID=A0ABM5Q498_9GAMM|nr:hypothetical protein [Yersinia similis]AHK21990.1 hypothetical protein BF17_16535 [Yersinia similis]CFQ60352.1 Uncharacterised protein [Yersinia similis]
MALSFTVLAGKPDNDDGAHYENIKFCDSADSMEAAQKIIQDNKLYTYPICRIEVTGFKAA